MLGRVLLSALFSVLAGLLAFAPAQRPENPPPPHKEAGNQTDRVVPASLVNLVPNGDFEKGSSSPDHWQQVDGLTTFWVDHPDRQRGKVIRFDTDVLQSQAYDWWVKLAQGAKASDAPGKLPTAEPKSNTLAGLEGVWFWSDFIPIEAGKSYWLTLDVQGTPDVMAWLVGYEKKGSTAFGADAVAFQEYLRDRTSKSRPEKRDPELLLRAFRYRGLLDGRHARPLENGWRRWQRERLPFSPTAKTPKVRYVRILVLPSWPPGICYLDNVQLTERGEK